MKLNITVGGQAKVGYFNIDPTANPNQSDKLALPLDQLDRVAEDSECTEIIIENVLQYIQYRSVPIFLNSIVKKMRHGCRLIIIFDDINVILKHFFRTEFTLEELNDIIYNGKQSTHSISSMEDILKSLNLNIESKEINQTKGIIIAKRG